MPVQKTRSTRKKEQSADLEAIGLEMGNKPPQAPDVEEAVLGAMLLEPMCVDQAMEELTLPCFYDPKHKMIYEAMCALVNEHTSVDIITVTAKLKALGNLEAVGGAVALANLSEKVGSVAHIEYYIKLLKQKTIQRDIITASYDNLKDAYDESVKVDDLIDKAQTRIFDAIQTNVRNEVTDIGSAINSAMKRIEEMQTCGGLSGVPSGYVSIDRITMGWQPSDLINHMPVAFFSLEMPVIQLATRLMIAESGLDADKIKGGARLESYEWEQLEYKIRDLSKAPLYIDDTPSLPIMEFRTKAKNLVKNKGVRLIIVDYLQLMQGPPELRGMREQEVAAISRTLKATAKELNVPIIALSQLRRMAESRMGGGGKPQLSDLRESGSIEQDADLVIFIHRPDFVGLSESEEEKEKTQIIIAKHRNGQTTDISMRFKGNQVRFVEDDDTLDIRAANMPVESAMNSNEFE